MHTTAASRKHMSKTPGVQNYMSTHHHDEAKVLDGLAAQLVHECNSELRRRCEMMVIRVSWSVAEQLSVAVCLSCSSYAAAQEHSHARMHAAQCTSGMLPWQASVPEAGPSCARKCGTRPNCNRAFSCLHSHTIHVGHTHSSHPPSTPAQCPSW